MVTAVRANNALPPITEADFGRQITDLAELLGWSWVHHRPAQTAHGWRTPVSGPLGAGWPDLVMVRERDHRVLYIEVKTDRGILSTEQREVLNLLIRSGQEAYVWRPSFGIDAIAEILR